MPVDPSLSCLGSSPLRVICVLDNLVANIWEHEQSLVPLPPAPADLYTDINKEIVSWRPLLTPLVEESHDIFVAHSQPAVEDRLGLAKCCHHAVLNPVVNYLEIMPTAT